MMRLEQVVHVVIAKADRVDLVRDLAGRDVWLAMEPAWALGRRQAWLEMRWSSSAAGCVAATQHMPERQWLADRRQHETKGPALPFGWVAFF